MTEGRGRFPIRRAFIWLAVALGAVIALAALGIGVVVALGRARDARIERQLRPFYDPPAPLPAGRPGDIIRQEPLDAPAGARVWRVLYLSTARGGGATAVSGMIAAPDREPPPGGFPVVALAHGTVGIARICAPSLQPFETRSVLPSFLSPTKDSGTIFQLLVEPFTNAGYAVAATDYRGMGTPGPNPYLVGEEEAWDVLDAARAIRRFPELRVSDQTLIWGQSQGGHSAAFAAQLAGSYAPELRIPGVVLGAPAAELQLVADSIVEDTGRSIATGLFVTIARSWSTVYPGLDAADVLTPRGLRKADIVYERCIEDVLLSFAFRPVPDYIEAEGARSPAWREQLERNTAGRARIAAPIRLFQGTADVVIRPEWTQAFYRRLCANGETVAFAEYAGLGHIDAILPSMPDTLAWMADRLAGRPAPSTC